MPFTQISGQNVDSVAALKIEDSGEATSSDTSLMSHRDKPS